MTRVSGGRKASISERSHSCRLELIGRLACGLAHDVNNILGVIRGNVDLLLTRTMNGRERQHRLEDVGRAVDRGAELTQRVLAFGRRQDGRLRSVDPNATLAAMKSTLISIVGDHIRLTINPGRDVRSVALAQVDLELVLINLAANARDAMVAGGELIIATANAAIVGSRQRSMPARVPTGGYVRMTLQDNGCGMDSRTVKRAFQPFFTTKERGKGTGLGLSIAASIVKEGRGYIWIDSSPRVGTAVSILLPIAPPSSVRVTPLRRRSGIALVRPESAGSASGRST